MIHVNHETVGYLAKQAATKIIDLYPNRGFVNVFPVPRGGVPAAYAIGTHLGKMMRLVESPEKADVFVDDIVDSGATKRAYLGMYPNRAFVALYDEVTKPDGWVVWPWEGSASASIEDAITRIIQFIGEDPKRGGLIESPGRVAKALQEKFSGYKQDPKALLKTFEDGAEGYDEMVVVRDIPFYSSCEHHFEPIFGTATVAYIPNKRIVGLSKISRLVDVFARRLQVQERLTSEVATTLFNELGAKGVGVVIKARHLCMEARGINKQGHETVTSSLLGVMKSDMMARAEFLNLAQSK